MLTSHEPPRMWWAGDEQGWMIDVRSLLSREMVDRCVAYTLKTQKQRVTQLPLGAKRDECLRTIAALESKRVRQNIVGTGDHVLYESTAAAEARLFVHGVDRERG